MHSPMDVCTTYLKRKTIRSVWGHVFSYQTLPFLTQIVRRDRIDFYAHDFTIGSPKGFRVYMLLLPIGSVFFLWFCSGIDLF